MQSSSGLTFDEVEVLRALCFEGTKAAAAQSLGVPRTTFGRRLGELETRLAHHFGQARPLFAARDGRFHATALGAQVLREWQPALDARARVEGLLDVPHVRVLPQHLFPRLLDRAAAGSVRLDVATENDRGQETFVDGLRDVALGYPLVAVGLDVRTLGFALQARKLYSTPYWVLTHRGRSVGRDRWDHGELRDVPLCLAPRGTRSRDTLDEHCARQGFTVDVLLESYSPMALVQAALRTPPERGAAVVLPADIALRFAEDEIFGGVIAQHMTWLPLYWRLSEAGPGDALYRSQRAGHHVIAYGSKDVDLLERVSAQFDELVRDVRDARERRADGQPRADGSGGEAAHPNRSAYEVDPGD